MSAPLQAAAQVSGLTMLHMEWGASLWHLQHLLVAPCDCAPTHKSYHCHSRKVSNLPDVCNINKVNNECFFIFFYIVVPCILITLKFLSPTNAPLYYTYEMLKRTVKISHDCSYMFRSTWTIIRGHMPNLAKVTIFF